MFRLCGFILTCVGLSYQICKAFGDCDGTPSLHHLPYGQSDTLQLLPFNSSSPVSCAWVITASAVRLNIDDLTLPWSDFCEDGYLQAEVTKWGQVKKLDRWCGDMYPRHLELSSRVVMQLYVRPSLSDVSLNLTYTSISPLDYCGETPQQLTGAGYLYSPGYGGHWTMSRQMACSWMVQAVAGHVIQVELLHVGLSELNCMRKKAALKIFTDYGTSYRREHTYCTVSELTVVKTKTREMFITYTDQEPDRGTGFKLKYYQMKHYDGACKSGLPVQLTAQRHPSYLTARAFPAISLESCSWNITTEKLDEIVVIETVDFDFKSQDCEHISLKLFDGPSPWSSKQLGQFCGRGGKSTHQTSSRHGYITMNINFSLRNYSSTLKVYSLPKVDLTKQHRIYIAYENTSQIYIPANLTSGRQILLRSDEPGSCIKVAISTQDTSLNNVFDVYDGQNRSATLYTDRCPYKQYTHSTGPALLLVYRGVLTSGFWLNYSTDARCDVADSVILPTNSSSFSLYTLPDSLHSPGRHGERRACRYMIATSKHSVVQLYIAIQPRTDCNTSNVVIADDLNSTNITGTWCSGISPVYVSSNNRMYVTYTGAGTSPVDRLHVVLFFKSQPQANISDNIEAPPGVTRHLTSPFYPNNYPNNALASWWIHTSLKNYRIEVKSRELATFHQVKPDANCTDDFLVFYDGSSSRFREIARWCGQLVSQTRQVQSSGQDMYIEFHSDSRETAKGFKTDYSATKHYTCNETLTAHPLDVTSSILTSPFYPENYHDHMTCTWILQTTAGETIQTKVAFAEFTGSSDVCSGDYLAFYDGRSELASLIGKVCGIEKPSYRSSRNAMYIVFRSDDNRVTGRGFQLVYYSTGNLKECRPGVIQRTFTNSSLNQYIASPDYPRNYQGNLNCQWRITARRGSVLQIGVKMTAADLHCKTNNIAIYDGRGIKFPLLGSFCGQVEGNVISSRDNVFINIRVTSGPMTFKVAYRTAEISDEAASGVNQTALSASVTAVLLVIIVILVINLVCWCRRRRNRKEPGTSVEKKEETKNERQANGFLVPTAPPLDEISNQAVSGVVLSPVDLPEGSSQKDDAPKHDSANRLLSKHDARNGCVSNKLGMKHVSNTSKAYGDCPIETIGLYPWQQLNSVRTDKQVLRNELTPESAQHCSKSYINADSRNCPAADKVVHFLEPSLLSKHSCAKTQRNEVRAVASKMPSGMKKPLKMKTETDRNNKPTKRGALPQYEKNQRQNLKKRSSIECIELENESSVLPVTSKMYKHHDHSAAHPHGVVFAPEQNPQPPYVYYQPPEEDYPVEIGSNCKCYQSHVPDPSSDFQDRQHVVEVQVHSQTVQGNEIQPNGSLQNSPVQKSESQNQGPYCYCVSGDGSQNRVNLALKDDFDFVICKDPRTVVPQVPLLVPIPEPAEEPDLTAPHSVLVSEVGLVEKNESLPRNKAECPSVGQDLRSDPVVIPGYRFAGETSADIAEETIDTTGKAAEKETEPPDPSQLKGIILPSHWVKISSHQATDDKDDIAADQLNGSSALFKDDDALSDSSSLSSCHFPIQCTSDGEESAEMIVIQTSTMPVASMIDPESLTSGPGRDDKHSKCSDETTNTRRAGTVAENLEKVDVNCKNPIPDSLNDEAAAAEQTNSPFSEQTDKSGIDNSDRATSTYRKSSITDNLQGENFDYSKASGQPQEYDINAEYVSEILSNPEDQNESMV